MSHLAAFQAGFDPTNPAAYPHILSIAISNATDVVITYLGAKGDTNYPGGPSSRTNVLECAIGSGAGSYSNNFLSTGLTNILSDGTGLGTNVTVTHSGGATNTPSRFYRVRVLP